MVFFDVEVLFENLRRYSSDEKRDLNYSMGSRQNNLELGRIVRFVKKCLILIGISWLFQEKKKILEDFRIHLANLLITRIHKN